ncbi:MAG: hypothetical protein WA361_05045 [Candidatus Acidiferrales bacterium]
MRSVFIAVLLSLIPFGSIAQDNPLKPDGRMWDSWSNLSPQSAFIKAAYVQGAMEGLRVGTLVGYYSGRLDEQSDALDHVKPCLKGPCAGIPLASLVNSSTDKFEAGANKVRGKYAPQNASVLDVVHQMDKFYSDYKNTPICMIVAVQESIFSLSGTASSEQQLELSRSGCNP